MADSTEIARKSLDLLASWKLAPDPASYELAFAYLDGSRPALTASIRSLLRTRRALTARDVARLRARHFPDQRSAERVEEIGDRLSDEVEQVADMIEAAVGVQFEAKHNLLRVKEKLGSSLDRVALRQIIEAILATAREAQEENFYLGSSLKQSQDDISRLQADLATIRAETLTDALTGVANRRHLNRYLRDSLKQAHASGRPLALLLVDVDHFKRFNDLYGHLTGDQVLKLIADTLRRQVKGQGFVARYGGEEFAVILSDADLQKAVSMAEMLRRSVASNELEKPSIGKKLGHVTISIGVATAQAGESGQALIEAADFCLYQAKTAGRNRVFSELDLAQPDGKPSAGSRKPERRAGISATA